MTSGQYNLTSPTWQVPYVEFIQKYEVRFNLIIYYRQLDHELLLLLHECFQSWEFRCKQLQ